MTWNNPTHTFLEGLIPAPNKILILSPGSSPKRLNPQNPKSWTPSHEATPTVSVPGSFGKAGPKPYKPQKSPKSNQATTATFWLMQLLTAANTLPRPCHDFSTLFRVYFRWTPPVIVTIRDNKDYMRVLLYSYYLYHYYSVAGPPKVYCIGIHYRRPCPQELT